MTPVFTKRIGIARVLNKAGYASRSACEKLVLAGRVSWNGSIVLNPEHPTLPTDQISIDGKALKAQDKVYLALNKPRGLVTTANDEQGRDTVYRCLEGLNLGHVGPVGRLDKASEGLLLFTNDSEWADSLLLPSRKLPKRYHVKWNGTPTPAQLQAILLGILDDGEILQPQSVKVIRENGKTCWLEVSLTEGKNREIRRIGASLGFETLRLVRIAIGNIQLGTLEKGCIRHLSPEEVENLRTFR